MIRRLAALVVPIFLETLLIMALGIADTIMLGLFDHKAVAAVGVVNQLLILIFLTFVVIVTGTTVVCSQCLGGRDHEGFVQTVGVSLVCNTLLGLAVSALLFFGGKSVLLLMGLQPELMDDADIYLKIVGGGAFLQALILNFSGVLRSARMPVWPMWAALAMNVINIAGNYMLIFGGFGMPALGVAGAGLSTLASRVLCVLMLGYITWRHVAPMLPSRAVASLSAPSASLWGLWGPLSVDKLKAVMRIGLPSAGEQSSYSLMRVVIVYIVNMLGTSALVAYSFTVNLIILSSLFSLAIGQGMAIYTGQLVGGRHYRAAYILGKYCLRVTVLVSLVVSLLTFVGGWLLVPMLVTDPAVLTTIIMVLFIDIIVEMGRAVNVLIIYSLRAIGDAVFPFLVGVVVMWSVGVGLGYGFGITLGGGLVGMWAAFALDEGIRAVVFIRRWEVWGRRYAYTV